MESQRDHRMGICSRRRVSNCDETLLWYYVTLVGSLLLRTTLVNYESGDYTSCLSQWYEFFLQNGQWQGLGQITERFSNYPPLYLYCLSVSTLLPIPKLYAIKLISIVSDYAAAWYVWKLVERDTQRKFSPWAALTCFLFAPTVVMNSSLWGQCDVMYTCGLLASVYYLLERRPIAALIAFGISASLKPQAFFFAPFLAGLILNRTVPWRLFWIPGFVYVLIGVPQMMAGRPALHVLGHWVRVQEPLDKMSYGATNWYQWVFEQHPEILTKTGFVLVLVASALFVLVIRQGCPNNVPFAKWIVTLAVLSVLYPPFLMPGMRERYFFAADVFAIVYAFYVTNGWKVAVLIQAASAFTYLPYLFHQEAIPRWLLAVVMSAALGLLVKQIVLYIHEGSKAPSQI